MKVKNSVVVLGASPNPNRTSYLAAKLLAQKGYNVKAFGKHAGSIDTIAISDTIPMSFNQNIDVISIFLKPHQQKDYYTYILNSKPKSIIFNPGSENPELEALAKIHSIKIVSCCTIALSAVGML